jgi:hypothetical protein
MCSEILYYPVGGLRKLCMFMSTFSLPKLKLLLKIQLTIRKMDKKLMSKIINLHQEKKVNHVCTITALFMVWK